MPKVMQLLQSLQAIFNTYLQIFRFNSKNICGIQDAHCYAIYVYNYTCLVY